MISLQNGARSVLFGSARDDAVGGFQVKIEPSASVSAASSAPLSLLPFKGRDSHHKDRFSNFGKFECSFESFVIFLKAVVDEDAHLGLAHQLYKSGNYKQALEHSSAVYERSPQRTDNLLLLGAIYYQLQDYDMCIAKNEEALRLEPRFAECYGNMANAWKEKGDIDLAIRYYLVSIE
ncbi:hypothetical protein OIU78_027516 [Salix suchowensis]|nr:hypothetical protein OIU78_027516 [Salix suchowensis]